MLKGIIGIKLMKVLMINLGAFLWTMFLSVDLGSMDWIKWPSTMAGGTLFYFIYNFYNARRTHDRADLQTIAGELREIIKELKEEITTLKEENTALKEQIKELDNKT